MNTATAQRQQKAKESLTGRSLLAQIKCNVEWDGCTLEDAEAISKALNGCALEEITIEQAYAMLREIHRTSKPVEVEPHDGYCMSCDRPSSLRQCMSCRGDGDGSTHRPHYATSIV
jgi:hypothetical protein